ncbi:hypothetical protein QBC38DRAFT_440022 [Podospora fimiseda]|uniref:Uncharacterized protein n=1 Tax=Podospora fimiseda TaxID=252190 RepID=A0AAN7BXL1_9PEZI|nr:hypothetical protein QBC38DRAFT_440022 [Podospora fimiseda]
MSLSWGFHLHKSDYATASPRQDRLSYIDGLVFYPQTHEQRRKLDKYEEAREVEEVMVWKKNKRGDYLGPPVEADMWVWDQQENYETTGPWDLKEFKRDRLETCLTNYREKMEREGKGKRNRRG